VCFVTVVAEKTRDAAQYLDVFLHVIVTKLAVVAQELYTLSSIFYTYTYISS